MIEIKNISKAFGEKIIFQDFSLTVNNGDFLVFTGKSGCGKSTILNIIGGLEKVDDGSVLFDGFNIYERKNQRKYYSEYVNFLFQNFALIESKTVRENLNIIPKQYREEISIEESLENVGLLNEIDTKVYKLSGGEQQRVALARVSLKKCKVILADEPTGSLDFGNAQEVIRKLTELNDNGKTIILVTHNLSIIPERAKVINL
ncbi:MAG: ATP-binding cassette domain-containing protein [Clostridiales bacterium]|jgi:putative ABC transport system ATP-binding protein|nr:ATP-binding cassette domain-containing protein [Clostridiales bacterium]